MKLNIKKLQEGSTVDFWGIQKGTYTPEYKNTVNSIANNPAMLTKLQSLLPQIKDRQTFLNLAADSVIGPVHKAINNIQTSTKPLPKHTVSYRSKGMGDVKLSSKQFVNLYKPEFDKNLAISNNDSTAAYYKTLEGFPNVKRNEREFINNPVLEKVKNNESFKVRSWKNGGAFEQSKFNFLNLNKLDNLPLLKIPNKINNTMDYNNVFNLINKYEGFKNKVYKDGKGIDTIGHGLTDKKYITKGNITEEESKKGVFEHIDKNVIPHLKNKAYWNNLSENQKTALISYVYNIGSGNFNVKSPSLQKALNDGNWEEAARQMDFGYNDKKNPGLKLRRDEERKLFLKDILN